MKKIVPTIVLMALTMVLVACGGAEKKGTAQFDGGLSMQINGVDAETDSFSVEPEEFFTFSIRYQDQLLEIVECELKDVYGNVIEGEAGEMICAGEVGKYTAPREDKIMGKYLLLYIYIDTVPRSRVAIYVKFPSFPTEDPWTVAEEEDGDIKEEAVEEEEIEDWEYEVEIEDDAEDEDDSAWNDGDDDDEWDWEDDHMGEDSRDGRGLDRVCHENEVPSCFAINDKETCIDAYTYDRYWGEYHNCYWSDASEQPMIGTGCFVMGGTGDICDFEE